MNSAMQVNVNIGQNHNNLRNGCVAGQNPMMEMMATLMKLMMAMMGQMMSQSGAQCPGGGALPPRQNPGFGGPGNPCQGGGNPLNGFLGGGSGNGLGSPGGFGSPRSQGSQAWGHPNMAPGNSLGASPCHRNPASPMGAAPQSGFQPSPNAKHPLPQNLVNQIAKFEGFDQPGKWPGYKSGITIGVGYDLGHVTKQQLYNDWKGKIPDSQLAQLSSAIGLKGQSARAVAGRFRNIHIPKNAALDVFHNKTVPKFYNQARRAFPGMEKLPANAQGALTSLVFNRGAGMSGARRSEMRNIRSAVGSYQGQNSLNYIAGQIQSMKRLWVGKGVDGLLTRRNIEASMVRGTYGGLQGYS